MPVPVGPVGPIAPVGPVGPVIPVPLLGLRGSGYVSLARLLLMLYAMILCHYPVFGSRSVSARVTLFTAGTTFMGPQRREPPNEK